jgi:chromosome segregation ATPase
MEPAHIGVISTAAVGILTALVSAYLSIRKSKVDETTLRESFVVKELKEMITKQDTEFEERLNRQVAECQERLVELRKERDVAYSRLSTASIDLSSARERIILLETLLEQHKVPFRHWVPPSSGGSAPSVDTIQG